MFYYGVKINTHLLSDFMSAVLSPDDDGATRVHPLRDPAFP